MIRNNIERFREFWFTLFGRVYLSYLFLTVAISLLNGFVFIWIWYGFSGRYVQAVYWESAEELARDIADDVNPVFNREAVEDVFNRYRRYSPETEPFLLDASGKVLVSLVADQLVPVNMEAVRTFVSHQGYPSTPIYGTRPQGSHERVDQLFSAHPLLVGGKLSYVYISLASDASVTTRGALGDPDAILGAVIFVMFNTVGAGLAGWLIFYFVTRRLRMMSGVVDEFSTGVYERRITESGRDELATLGTVLNSMANAIQSQIRELTNADAARRELVAGIAHDIRGPIAQIRLSLEGASKLSTSLNEEQQEFVSRSLRALQSLNMLVEDLFELSKVSAEAFNLTREPLHVGELIEELVQSFSLVAKEREIEIQHVGLEKDIVMQLDAKYFSRGVSNLLDNAIKYSNKGGKVYVELRDSPSGFSCTIRDEGVGIAEEDLEFLSQPFHRGKHGRSKHVGGTGLGLAIARKVIELHGGMLYIRNAETQGAEVIVSLPREAIVPG